MLNFVFENLSTILVGAVVFAIVAAVCIKLILDIKNKRSTCGCGCSKCPSAGACHEK